MDHQRIKTHKERLTAEHQKLAQAIHRNKIAVEEVRPEHTEDEGDLATLSHNRDLLYKLQEGDFVRLKLIEQALLAIDRGQYGDCDRCEEEISEQRLRAVPWTRLCIACQETAENESLPSPTIHAGTADDDEDA